MKKIIYDSINLCKKEKYNKALQLLKRERENFSWEEKLILSSIVSFKSNKKKLLILSKEISELLPKSKFAFNNLGNCYYYLDKIELAILAYKKSLKKRENEIDFNLYFKKFQNKIRYYTKQIKKNKKNQNLIFQIFLKDLMELREKLAIKQVITSARPHFAELYNRIECLIKKINEAYRSVYKSRNKINILKNINDLKLLENDFLKINKINADYENAYFNLGKCYLIKKNYNKSIKYLKLANKLNRNNRFDSKILEVLYISKQKRKFKNFVKKFKNKKRLNFESFAICEMVSEQWNTKNNYSFCNNPINYIFKTNIFNNKEVKKNFLLDIEKEIKQNRTQTYTPVVVGYKSTGNIFDKKSKNILLLKKIIKKNIINFKNKYSNFKNILINKFPSNFYLNGWYISLKKGGEVTSHVHHGWLSGVFYIKKSKSKQNNFADIEFSTKYKDIPTIKNNYSKKRLETKVGDIVLFPSSLPHRVVPFKLKEERLSIAFDMKPIY